MVGSLLLFDWIEREYMALILKADARRIIFMYIISAVGIGFGYMVYSSIPQSFSVRYAFVIIPLIAAILSILSVHIRRVTISEKGVSYRSLIGNRFVPLSDIREWKFQGGGPKRASSRSLHFLVANGRDLNINQISMLGVNNEAATSHEISKYFKYSRKSIGKVY